MFFSFLLSVFSALEFGRFFWFWLIGHTWTAKRKDIGRDGFAYDLVQVEEEFFFGCVLTNDVRRSKGEGARSDFILTLLYY